MFDIKILINESIEKLAINLFKKTKCGNLTVRFPSKKIINFSGKSEGVTADIKLNNYLMVKYLDCMCFHNM